MGLLTWMEKKAQQGVLKVAMQVGWTASCCISMVFLPLTIALKEGQAKPQDVRQLIGDQIDAWKKVLQLSDRNLHRNREYHEIKPNRVLSPILLGFEHQLVRIGESHDLDVPARLEALEQAQLGVIKELFDFHQWAKAAGPLIGFDSAGYEDTAARIGQEYWASTLQQLMKA